MQYQLLIDGALRAGAGQIKVINPATGAVLTQCPRSDLNQADEAIAAAKRAFPAWSALGQTERRRLLLELADRLDTRRTEFATLLVLEQGKPYPLAVGEVMQAVDMLRINADFDLPPRVLRDEQGGRIVEVRSPLGVVLAITPWNFPLFLLMVKLAPALMSGNTLVIKPAPTTPLTTLLLARLCAELLPPGVVNTVIDENDLGAHLTSHPDIAKIAFTGSTTTGRKVMASAAATIKRLTLELVI